jgi:hypothetical protein
MKTVQDAYAKFRAKWGAWLPDQFRSTDQWDFARLRAATLAEVRSVMGLHLEDVCSSR